MKPLDRFLNYVKIDTQSDDKSDAVPSTIIQLDLCRLLVKELHDLGIDNAYMDEYGVVYAHLDGEGTPIGLNAHVDTATNISGRNVKPQIVYNYDGGDIKLNDRKVSKKIIMKAFRLMGYTILVLVLAISLIDIFEGNAITFESIIFECVSAISTVGLSMGITSLLSIPSKLVLIMLMFVGRVGLITVVLAITNKGNNKSNQDIEFSNTDIIIG